MSEDKSHFNENETHLCTYVQYIVHFYIKELRNSLVNLLRY